MQISWIDDADIQGLLKALSDEAKPGPAPESLPAAATAFTQEASAADAIPPSAPPAVSEAMRQRLQAIRERALRSGALSPISTEPALAAQRTTPPAGPPTHPGQDLQDWVQRHRRAERGLLLADERGRLIGGAPSDAISVTHELQTWIASSRVSALFAGGGQALLRRRAICGRHLLAMPCPSRQGMFYLALYSQQPPSEEDLPVLRSELLARLEA